MAPPASASDPSTAGQPSLTSQTGDATGAAPARSEPGSAVGSVADGAKEKPDIGALPLDDVDPRPETSAVLDAPRSAADQPKIAGASTAAVASSAGSPPGSTDDVPLPRALGASDQTSTLLKLDPDQPRPDAPAQPAGQVVASLASSEPAGRSDPPTRTGETAAKILLLRVGPTIHSLGDLEGKRIAIQGGDPSVVPIASYSFESLGLSPTLHTATPEKSAEDLLMDGYDAALLMVDADSARGTPDEHTLRIHVDPWLVALKRAPLGQSEQSAIASDRR